MKRFRVLLLTATVLATLIQAPVRSTAQNVPANVIYPSTSGTVGSFTVSSPGAICRTESATTSPEIRITVTGPKAQVIGSDLSGRVDWTPAIYQELFDSRGRTLVATGVTQSLTISRQNSTAFASTLFAHLPGGGFYSAGGTLTWYDGNASVRGAYSFIFERYDSQHAITGNNCHRIAEPALSLSRTRATVDTVVSLYGTNFPLSQPVKITWRGSVVGTVMSDASGNVSGSYRLPAAPMGTYQLGFDGNPVSKLTLGVTIVPRVKLIPSSAGRGQTVKISLRGYAKGETVRVRWLKGGSWVELGRVKMSSTGSGELWVAVPNWVPDGTNSVRGDGTSGRAQTNAVYISGGAAFSTASEKTPTPTATVMATTTATIPASPEISPTVTEPTATVSPTETATETVTAEPTIEPSPTTTETATPTETPIATESPVDPTSTPPA